MRPYSTFHEGVRDHVEQSIDELETFANAPGWHCRPCQRGDHRNCDVETNTAYCVCLEGACAG